MVHNNRISSVRKTREGTIAMARQSLNPVKKFDYRENIEKRKVGRKRKDAPVTHLKYLRKKNGYSLETLSEITSISVSYLSRLESGSRRLNTDLIKRLSHAFSCSPAELLQEVTHDSSVITPVEFNKAHKMDVFPEHRSMQLHMITQENGASFCIKPILPEKWKLRPAELGENENIIAVKAGDVFKPYFSESSTLYLDSDSTLSPESSVIIFKDKEVLLKKVWSITPTSLQLCDLSDIENLKAGKNGTLIEVDRRSLGGLYKVVGYSDFDINS